VTPLLINEHLPKPLKVAVIREEFVALTGDTFQAIVLNQFIYWVQKVNDFDKFILEERLKNPDCNVSLRHGWIYKKAQDLIEETMLHISEVTMRRVIKGLVDRGWIEERTNLDNKWDKVLQYRPDLTKIQKDLYNLGFSLSGFPLLRFESDINSSILQNKGSNLQNEASELQKSSFISKDTETTAEITTHTARGGVADLMLEVWNKTVPPKTIPVSLPAEITSTRSSKLKFVFQQHFQGDMPHWKTFCNELTQSSFLMGKGPRGWFVTLDWILDRDNLQKVLEGNYKNAAAQNNPAPVHSPEECDLKAKEYIAKIESSDLKKLSEGLRKTIGSSTFLSWFTDIEISCSSENLLLSKTLIMKFPTKFKKTYVETHFKEKILAVARSLFPASKIQWLECEVLDSSSKKPSSEFVSCFEVFSGDKDEPCHEAQLSSLTSPETFLSGNSQAFFSGKEHTL
jgi:hypothetical protein